MATNYGESKERRRMREELSVAEQKEMCEMFGGTWVPSYHKGHIEVAGYCRDKQSAFVRRMQSSIRNGRK